MVEPLVGGLSKTLEVFGTSPLDASEREGGTIALSALMRQYGGQLDAKVLVLMWVAGVSLPRLAEYAEKRRSQRGEPKTVQGEAKVVSREGAA